MNDNRERDPDSPIDKYVDGLLDPAQVAEFEDHLRTNPELTSELELNSNLDRSLQRQFEPPDVLNDQLMALSQIEQSFAGTGSGAHQPATIWKWAVAAGLFVCAVGLWYWQLREPDNEVLGGYNSPALVEIYQKSVDTGFQPRWLCEDDREFAETFLNRQGQALVLGQLPQGSRMVGLAYLGGFSPNTTTLMCFVDDRPVMVFVDRVVLDRQDDTVQPTNSLNIFRRELGELLLYEVSPYPEARVFDFLIPVDELPPARS